MKAYLLAIIVLLFYSCSINKIMPSKYYHIEPFKEQEINLYLKHDSTFSLIDLTGCNQFEIIGRYKKLDNSVNSYFVFDLIKLQNVLSNTTSHLVFPLKNGDTAWLINKERLFINHIPFKATSKTNINLQKVRYKKLKDYYIELLVYRHPKNQTKV